MDKKPAQPGKTILSVQGMTVPSRTHKKDAEAYAALKTELAEKFTYDNEGYCDGKDSFVKDLERKALEWRKTMSV